MTKRLMAPYDPLIISVKHRTLVEQARYDVECLVRASRAAQEAVTELDHTKLANSLWFLQRRAQAVLDEIQGRGPGEPLDHERERMEGE